MNTLLIRTIPVSLMAAAVAMAFVPKRTIAADEIDALTKPESSVTVGVGNINHDNRYFGQYSGMHKDGIYGLLDVNIEKRNEDTGTWLLINGRNLGLDHLDFRAEHARQGDWGYFLDYSQTPRRDPLEIKTGVTGIGSSTLRLPTPYPNTNGVEETLKTMRKTTNLGFSKTLSGGFDFQVNFRNEEKDGSRLFARGTTGGTGGFEFAPEPINSTTRIFEGTLGYTADKFQFTGGYVGSFYNNHNPALNFTNSPAAGVGSGFGTFNPMALPPDNQSHQLFVNGGYNLSPTSRASFKFAQSRVTQENDFVIAPAAGIARSDLGGQIDITQAQASFTAKPLPKLSVLANVRYEDRDDETPVVKYFTAPAATATTDGNNEPRSIRTLAGKLEASYLLPMGFRATGGVDYDEKTRNTSAVRAVSFRRKTEENSYRLELRRSLSEELNGSIAYIRSDRDGSNWQTTVLNNGTTGSNLVAPLHLADRTRDKIKLKFDWAPIDPLSFQFVFENSDDDYGSKGRSFGLQDGRATLYSLDATWTINDKWKTSAWVMSTDTRATQRTCESATAAGVCPNTLADPIWEADLRSLGNAVGFNLQGKATSRIDLGADFQYSHDKMKHGQSSITAGSTVPSDLPNTYYKLATSRLYGTYALEKNSSLRLDLVHLRQKTDDWTWQNFTYSDGTRVVRKPSESTVFIGASYTYRFN